MESPPVRSDIDNGSESVDPKPSYPPQVSSHQIPSEIGSSDRPDDLSADRPNSDSRRAPTPIELIRQRREEDEKWKNKRWTGYIVMILFLLITMIVQFACGWSVYGDGYVQLKNFQEALKQDLVQEVIEINGENSTVCHRAENDFKFWSEADIRQSRLQGYSWFSSFLFFMYFTGTYFLMVARLDNPPKCSFYEILIYITIGSLTLGQRIVQIADLVSYDQLGQLTKSTKAMGYFQLSFLFFETFVMFPAMYYVVWYIAQTQIRSRRPDLPAV